MNKLILIIMAIPIILMGGYILNDINNKNIAREKQEQADRIKAIHYSNARDRERYNFGDPKQVQEVLRLHENDIRWNEKRNNK